MEMQGDHVFGNYNICNGDIQEFGGDTSMQYSAEQVMLLEQFFVECQKPNHGTRIAMIRENSVLSNLNSQQIQAWFENRRYLEKKKKDAFVSELFLFQKMLAIGTMLLLQNDILHSQVQQLLRKKRYICDLLKNVSLESFLALEVPRSVFGNVKAVATTRLLLLRNQYLHNEVQHMLRDRDFMRNLHQILSNIESTVNSYRSWSAATDSSQGLPLHCGTITKFPLKTPSEFNCVSIPRMKFFGGLKEKSVNTFSDLTYFSVNGNINDVPVILSFVKAAMVPGGPLDFLRKNQEFILCCSLKLAEIMEPIIRMQWVPFAGCKDGSSRISRVTNVCCVVPALTFLPQGFRVVVGRYCLSGAWSYFPDEPAASGNVKLVQFVSSA